MVAERIEKGGLVREVVGGVTVLYPSFQEVVTWKLPLSHAVTAAARAHRVLLRPWMRSRGQTTLAGVPSSMLGLPWHVLALETA